MILRTRCAIATIVGAFVLAGCARTTGQPLTPNEAPVSANLQSITEAAIRDAARQTGLAKEALAVVSAGAVTWSDGSLGCPQPGMMYTQALVPGYRIRIQAGPRVLDYHASARGQLLLCPDGRAIEPSPQDAI